MPAGAVSVAAAAVNLADAVFLAVYTTMHHMRTPRPSTLIIMFLALTGILDGLRCRTLWLVDELQPLACAFSASLAAKLVLFVLETHNKRSILIQDWRELGAEATSSIVGILFMTWVNPMLMIGNRSFLQSSDVPRLAPKYRSQSVLPQVLQNWHRYKDSGRFALLLTAINILKWDMVIAAIPRFILSLFKLATPLYISLVISHVRRTDAEEVQDKNVGYALIAGGVLLFVGRPLVEVATLQAKEHVRIRLRSSVTSAILHYGAQMEPGEKKGSAALTLITVDVGRVCGSFFFLQEVWFMPLEIGFAIYMLSGQLGWGFIGPLVTIVAGAFITGFVGSYVGPAQLKLNEAVEKRVSDTTTVIGSMRETKMLGLVDSWFIAIERLLSSQIRASLAFRRLMVILNVVGKLPDSLAPPISFGIAILMSKNGRLSVNEAFTSLNIMFLIVQPIATLSFMYPFILSALPCFTRIQDFMKLCGEYETRLALTGASAELPTDDALIPSLGDALFSTENADVTVKSKEEPLLKNANLKIMPGTFNVIAGKVGMGKSVLLQALLGQLNMNGNSKVRTSNVAYCAQVPWIISGTAKQNVICKSEEDEIWYKTVITACALDRDFEDFARGDATIIGTKGVSLSGGQKQRMSLARGLFSRKKIIFVDDVLSGLDWATQRLVWDQVFGPDGLLRKNDITVVLATHALHLIEQPDSVILVGDEGAGSVIQGTLDELKAKTKIQDLIATSRKSADEGDANVNSASSQKGNADAVQDVDEAEKEKELHRKTGDMTLYAYYLNMVGANGIIWFAAVVALAAVWPLVPQLWLKLWTEANESPEPINTAYYYGIYTALNVGDMITMLGALYYAALYLAPNGLKKMHTRLLKATMAAPMSFFIATPPGDLINRFSRDIEQIDLDLPLNIMFSWMSLVWLIALVGPILIGSVYMAVIIAPMIIFVYFLQSFYLKTSRQMRYIDLQSSGPLNTHIIEMIDGVSTVQAYGWESQYQKTGMELMDNTMRPNYTLRSIQNWLEMAMNLFVSGACILLVTICVLAPSSTTEGGVALALTNVTLLGNSLAWFIQSYTQTETALGSVERVRSFEQQTPKETPPVNPRDVPDVWPSKGALSFKSVVASYPPKDNTPAFRALNGIEIDIKPGEKVAVCGRTGSGKSSLLMTMFRLLDLESGSISIDGIDITDIQQNVLRPRLISVPQDPLLLPGSLRSNLVRNTTEEEVIGELEDEKLINHLKTVELWEIVEKQGGLNCDASDLKLSQGQKQLVCMARALANKDTSSILVLDEAMSTVDKQTEELMVKILEDDFKNHTIISVVHRLNTVEKFDTVLLLDSGVVVESGSPKDLLAKENGRFRALWQGKEA